MALTAAQIVNLSVQAAKCPGFLGQAGQVLNVILDELCQNYDLDSAKGFYQFNFQPGLVSTINNNVVAGGGPYPLPSDYRRSPPGEVFWTLLGVPYPMINISLEEFDATVQQAGLQSYPYWYTTDMSQSPPVMYVYPPASGAYPVTVRYYRQMPDITQPESSSTVPWFPNTQFLRTRLTAELMAITDDERQAQYLAEANEILDRYLKMKDDKESRTDNVRFDRRRFGKAYSSLKSTKTVGW